LHFGFMIVFQKKKSKLKYIVVVWINGLSRQFDPTTFLFGSGIVSVRLYRKSSLDLQYYSLKIKQIFVGSFYYSTCKFDRANDEFDRTRRFETSPNCCHQERFQMFITTPIGATSTNFVVKKNRSTCGSLRKSFWTHGMKNTQPHLKAGLGFVETHVRIQ